MKIILIILGVIIIAFSAVQLFAMSTQNDIETYSYTVVKKYDSFEIRKYEATLFTAVKMPSNKYNQASRKGFSILAGYIFGGNDEKKKIAMTSPVIMDMGDETKMSFVMPKEHSMASLPEPNSDQIEILRVSPKKYAVLTFPGYANNKKIAKYSKKLRASVKSEGIETVGNIQFMGYNAPWQVLGRKNEVAIEVK